MKRRLYLIAAVILALTAALITLRAQHTVEIVVANHNVSAGTQLSSSDVHLAALHSSDVPANVIADPAAVQGKYVSWPLTGGEPVLTTALSTQWSGNDVAGGYDLPSGYTAVGIAVSPASAVGGMLQTGDRVDVYATPNAAASAAGSSAGQPVMTGSSSGLPAFASTTSPETTLLGHDLLVLQLRNDQGQAMDAAAGSSVHGLNFGSGKLGSVVVAVPTSNGATFAAAAASDTMYITLSVS